VKYKLIILVLCSSANRFKKLEKAIKQTWATVKHPQVKIIFYTDNYKSFLKKEAPVMLGDDLILPCKDGLLECTEKTLQAFEYVMANFDFEYIFRVNLGSYVSLKKIISFLNDKPKTKFYAGIIGRVEHKGQSIPFASGSGYFLSHDMVKLITDNRADLNNTLIDDIALGIFMNDNNININTSAIRLSYVNEKIEYHAGDKVVDSISDNLLYHIRIRSMDRGRDISISSIKSLHNIIQLFGN
jgi:hypothetical protein